MSGLLLRLPPRLQSRLEAEAQRRGHTPQQVAKDVLAERFAPAGRPRRRSLYDRTRDLCGSLAGGPPDLARNQAHLEGYGAWKR